MSKPTHKADGTFKKRRFGKYNAKGQRIDGVWFASAAEATRYGQLLRMLDNRQIIKLELQPTYSITVDGMPICNYRADFRYQKLSSAGTIGVVIVEDVKGMRTDVYAIKKKLFEAKFKMPLYEIPSSKIDKYEGLTADASLN